jgi:hypothetical protein
LTTQVFPTFQAFPKRQVCGEKKKLRRVIGFLHISLVAGRSSKGIY